MSQFVRGAAGARCRRPRNTAGRACRTCSASRSRNISSPPTMAFAMYPGLTHGAIAAILVKGSDEQKAKYLPKMVSGEWSGTMNLTEPHCGTDLGLIRTRAEPQRRRQLRDHRHQDLHLGGRARPDRQHHPPRARQDRPARPTTSRASRCSSCPSSSSTTTARSARATASSCGSIEHKMGIHGNSTCVHEL